MSIKHLELSTDVTYSKGQRVTVTPLPKQKTRTKGKILSGPHPADKVNVEPWYRVDLGGGIRGAFNVSEIKAE